MNTDEFIQAINKRDADIRALTEYALALERAVARKRSEDAADEARTRVYDDTFEHEIASLRYEHGLRAGTLTQR